MTVEKEIIEKILTDWPENAKNGAYTIIGKYGDPDEATPSLLIWRQNGTWKRTIAYRDETPHKFPAPHPDLLEQVIDYSIPVNLCSDVLAFDGSIIIDRTRGEVAARCDKEAMNILALNLMHDIVTKKLSTDQARKKYSEIAVEYNIFKKPSEYTQTLLFEPQKDTAEVDTIIMSGMIKEEWDRGSERIREYFTPNHH
jgi:hypothetical protein